MESAASAFCIYRRERLQRVNIHRNLLEKLNFTNPHLRVPSAAVQIRLLGDQEAQLVTEDMQL